MTVVWRFAATNDLSRIIRYISTENPIAAKRLARDLVLAADSLAVFPERGRRGVVPGTRELVHITPYVIVYEVDEGNEVAILRVWHAAQERM